MRLRKLLTTSLSALALAFVAVAIAALAAPLPAQAKSPGVVLAPQTAQQMQAAELLVKASQLLQQKKPFAARAGLEQAAALWPESPHIHYNLGCCYEQLGLFEKAIAEFERALSLEPRLAECIENIASCYQLLGKPQQAIVTFEGYLKSHPRGEEADTVRNMIAALKRQASRQVESNPDAPDYFDSISASGRAQRWQYDRLPIKIFISAGCSEDGHPVPEFHPNYNNILYEAFVTWQKASNGRLAYQFVPDSQQADITCWWTDRVDFLRAEGTKVEQGAAKVAARPLKDGSGEEIGHVKVIILIKDHESGRNITDENMKKACLHEIGHALGFAGHSTNNRDIMFFSDSPTVWASLTKRDKATMARLYADYPVVPGMATANIGTTGGASDAFGGQANPAMQFMPGQKPAQLPPQQPAQQPIPPQSQWSQGFSYGQPPQQQWLVPPGQGQQQSDLFPPGQQ